MICFSYCYSCKKYIYIVFPFSTLSTPLPALVIRSFFCIQIRPFLITQRTVSRNALIFSFVSSISFEVRKRQFQILLGQYRISNFLSCSSEFVFVLSAHWPFQASDTKSETRVCGHYLLLKYWQNSRKYQPTDDIVGGKCDRYSSNAKINFIFFKINN